MQWYGTVFTSVQDYSEVEKKFKRRRKNQKIQCGIIFLKDNNIVSDTISVFHSFFSLL